MTQHPTRAAISRRVRSVALALSCALAWFVPDLSGAGDALAQGAAKALVPTELMALARSQRDARPLQHRVLEAANLVTRASSIVTRVVRGRLDRAQGLAGVRTLLAQSRSRLDDLLPRLEAFENAATEEGSRTREVRRAVARHLRGAADVVASKIPELESRVARIEAGEKVTVRSSLRWTLDYLRLLLDEEAKRLRHATERIPAGHPQRHLSGVGLHVNVALSRIFEAALIATRQSADPSTGREDRRAVLAEAQRALDAMARRIAALERSGQRLASRLEGGLDSDAMGQEIARIRGRALESYERSVEVERGIHGALSGLLERMGARAAPPGASLESDLRSAMDALGGDAVGRTDDLEQAIVFVGRELPRRHGERMELHRNRIALVAELAAVLSRQLTELVRRAEAGDTAAAYRLGRRYLRGLGVVPDPAVATGWIFRAAQAGHAGAMGSLGRLYIAGRGVPVAEEYGVQWLRRGAERGDAVAQHSLGLMYQSGRGVSRSTRDALVWYEKAAAQGHKASRNNLAWLLATSPDESLHDGARAVALMEPVIGETSGEAMFHDTLAAAYARAGRFEDAVIEQTKALRQLDGSTADADTQRDRFRARLELYRAGEPYTE